MKYNVGDKVVIRDDLEIGTEYGKNVCVYDMLYQFGKTVKIKSKFNSQYMVEGSEYLWTNEMIDHEKTKELNDLKTYKSWELMKLIDEDYEEVEGKTFKMVKNEKHTWSTIGIGSKVQVSSSSHSGKGLYEDGSKVYVSGSEIWEEIKETVTFMEAVESGSKVRFYYNKTYNTDEYMQLDELMDYMGEMYTHNGIRAFIEDAVWYIE